MITALPILITLNLKYAGKSGIQGLDRLGWSGIDPGHTRIFWLHSALQVTFNVYFCSLIGAEVCAILSYQQKLIKASVQTSSVLIRGIPKEDMSEEILSQMYDKVSRGVRRVWLFRDDAKIREMIQRRKKLLDRLEVAQTAFIIRAVKARASLASQSAHNTGTKQHSTTHRTGPLSLSPSKEYRDVMRQPVPHSGWRPILMCSRPKVDVIDYCRAEIAMLNQDIENATSKLWQVAPQNAAIIEFNHRIDAHVVSQARAHESPFQFCTEILDISGTRFNVDSFNMKWWQRYMRFASVTAASLTLLIGWALPVALTGFVSQIAYLEGLYPSLARVPKWILVFLQGALPQCTLILLTMGLPSVVQLLISQLRLSQASHVGKWTQRLYFSFLFIHVFLTVAVSSSVTTVIDRLYHGVNNVPELLASNLPKSSNYFLSYLLIQALSISAAQVLQPVRLVQYYILSPLCDASPRQKYERQTAASTQEWAIIYPVYTNLACIGKYLLL